MKATYCPALVCECGYAMLGEYCVLPGSPALSRSFRCVNGACKWYDKKFKAPMVEIELVAIDGNSDTTR